MQEHVPSLHRACLITSDCCNKNTIYWMTSKQKNIKKEKKRLPHISEGQEVQKQGINRFSVWREQVPGSTTGRLLSVSSHDRRYTEALLKSFSLFKRHWTLVAKCGLQSPPCSLAGGRSSSYTARNPDGPRGPERCQLRHMRSLHPTRALGHQAQLA